MTTSDVIVVGSGFAGLSAARACRAEGLKAVVLEARDRPGGRALTRSIAGQAVEMGAQWVGPGQPEVAKLARAFDFVIQPRPSEGREVFYAPMLDGEGPGSLLNSSPIDMALGFDTITQLDHMAASIDLAAPARSNEAIAWDRESVASWVDKSLSPDGAHLVRSMVEGFLGLPEQISFLHLLFYARANGGFAALLGMGDVLHDSDVLPQGLGALAAAVAEDLGPVIQYNHEVTEVHHDPNHVSVSTRSGDSFSAKAVIMAIPPIIAAGIRFTPQLSPARLSLQRRYTPFSRLKFQAVFAQRFWLKSGLSGTSTGGSFITFDGSTHYNRGVITGFFGAREALTLWTLPQPERAKIVSDRLTLLFGSGARDMIGYDDRYWLDEPFSQGCVAAPGPGLWSNFGSSLRTPCGPIFWAGSETATVMPGQVEGAILSGINAVQQFVQAAGFDDE